MAPVVVSSVQGIGSALIEAALDVAKEGEWEAIFVFGDPTLSSVIWFWRCQSLYAGEYFMMKAFIPNLPATWVVAYFEVFDSQ